ncbi:carbohydrate porin [soil metagenome]
MARGLNNSSVSGSALATAMLYIITPQTAEAQSEPTRGSVDISVQYTGDAISDVQGGVDQGTSYLHKVEIVLDAAGSIAGVADLHAFIDAGQVNGVGFSRRLVGDAQGVSNIEAFRGLDLFQAWVSKAFPAMSATATVGLIDLNSNFDTQNVGALFMNSSHGVGAELSHSGLTGPSIFPLSSLGGVFEKTIAPGPDGASLTLRLGVFDGIPGDPAAPDHFAVRLGRHDGVLLIGQVERALGPDASIQVGYWQYTAAQPLTLPTPGGPAIASGDRGGYVRLEGPLAHFNGDSMVAGWVRAGLADARFGSIANYIGGGAKLSGVLFSGGSDALGLSVASAGFSRRFRASTGAPALPASRETTFELTYRTPPWRGFAIQPDLQFVQHPGGDLGLPNAIIVGLRLAFKGSLFAASTGSGP